MWQSQIQCNVSNMMNRKTEHTNLKLSLKVYYRNDVAVVIPFRKLENEDQHAFRFP